MALSCYAQTTEKSAIAFNDEMSVMITEINKEGTEWAETFCKIDSTKQNFASLAPLRIRMEKYIDGKLSELRTMQDISNSYDFRMAVIHFMEIDKNLLNTVFKEIEKLSPNSSIQQKQNALTNLNKQSKKEDMALKKIKALQIAYAKQNGFTMGN
jgi:hypothetical protein